MQNRSLTASVALIAGLVLVPSCGSSSSTSTATPVTPTTTTPLPISAPLEPPPRFVGTWYVHDGQLTITAEGTGTETYTSAMVAEIDSLSFMATGNETGVTGTIRSIRYLSNGQQVPDPDPQDAQKPGDTFKLTWINQHLLKSTFLRSSLPQIDISSANPYWCGGGPGTVEQVISRTPSADMNRCGA